MSRRPTAPTGWSYSSIGEVCTFGRGVSWKKSQERRLPTQDAVPVLRIPNVQKTLDLTRLMYIDGLSKAQQAKARVKRGWTLLVGSNGNPKRVGNCVYVDDPCDFLFASFLVSAKSADARRVDGAFLYRLLSSTPVQNDICQSLQGSTGLRNIDLWALKSLRALVPPLPEQRKIAAILSSVDDAIEKTQAVIDQVQVVKRGLMHELLTRGLPGRHTRFKKTEIGEIPQDWAVVRIGQLGVVEAGRQRYPGARGEPRSYLRVANVFDGYIDAKSLLSMPFTDAEFARYKLRPGDLLLNEGQSRQLVGRCAQYLGRPRDCCFQNTLIRFCAGGRLTPRYAFWLFRQCFYSGRFSSIARQTTSVAHLGVKRFAAVRIGLPTLEEQEKITQNLETVSCREEVERDKLVQLRAVKSGLMSVLLTGELRVTPDPEPA